MKFAWQHSIRAQPDGTYKLYDNEAAPPVRKNSRVLTLKLDTAAKTATLVSAFTHPRKLLSASQGNVERLPNGNTFVGWGSQRWFTEFSPTGQVLFDGHLAKGNDNYRAFRYEWTGRPAQPPKVVAAAGSGNITGRVSWNGATGIARWELLAGADAASLAPGRREGLGGLRDRGDRQVDGAAGGHARLRRGGQRASSRARRSSRPPRRRQGGKWRARVTCRRCEVEADR